MARRRRAFGYMSRAKYPKGRRKRQWYLRAASTPHGGADPWGLGPNSCRGRAIRPPARQPKCQNQDDHAARAPFRPALRPAADRAGDRAQPLLSGAALHRHGLRHAADPGRHARRSRPRAAGAWSAPNTARSTRRRTISPRLSRRSWDPGDVANLAALTGGGASPWSLCRGRALAWRLPLGQPALPRRRRSGPVSLLADKAPLQSRRMDLADIRDYRRAHRAAALRAHGGGRRSSSMSMPAHTYLLSQFLEPPASTSTIPGYSGSHREPHPHHARADRRDQGGDRRRMRRRRSASRSMPRRRRAAIPTASAARSSSC